MKNKILLFLLLLMSWPMYAVTPKETFEVGKRTFLLNGNPFVVKAAELHYARIPEPYWEHRILMCKALGMNTICLYMFWNYHEQQEGKFDFSGEKNVAKFCKLAQKHGMYIILRPGPYVCAEWEMGGLPWWLLKEKDMKVRSLNPYFMERTEIFMKELGKQLAPLQLANGGNIIMVQVENEFGGYGVDKPYMTAIRDIVCRAGFDKSVLFQCDWDSTFELNALDDLLWTLNFGTGANIDKEFKKLSTVRPDTPLMCSEFWSGWFDHWGRKHETRPAEKMVEGIKDMLDRNISFSLYMTHGGTTFGHWGGANSPTYSAMCSSYDYDAPISEAGWTTPKYYLLQELLGKYRSPEEKECPVPEPFPVIEIPAVELNAAAPLFEQLPDFVQSEQVKPMEDFNQGWGSILYRTTLPATEANTLLRITEAHDWAQIYADGKLLGYLDRRKDDNQVILPQLPEGTQLDIWVEAMGRVNFGSTVHDRKGITEKVELIKPDKQAVTLKNWKVYSIPVDYKFAARKKYSSNSRPEGPAYYKATFNLTKTGDTFIDMSTWGKGMVWVNGHALGRFWEIGPQQTLFLPGCWLKKGKNEIIVLDLKGPSEAVVKGLKTPVLDILREKERKNRQKGDTLDLSQETPVYKGAFAPVAGWQEVKFAQSAQGQYFCLEALSAQDGKTEATLAELEILGADGKPIPREQWRIRYADSEETYGVNATADKIYDQQESTCWMTKRRIPYPHQVVIDLGEVKTVTGLRYLPSFEKGNPGMIKDFSVYVNKQAFRY